MEIEDSTSQAEEVPPGQEEDPPPPTEDEIAEHIRNMHQAVDAQQEEDDTERKAVMEQIAGMLARNPDISFNSSPSRIRELEAMNLITLKNVRDNMLFAETTMHLTVGKNVTIGFLDQFGAYAESMFPLKGFRERLREDPMIINIMGRAGFSALNFLSPIYQLVILMGSHATNSYQPRVPTPIPVHVLPINPTPGTSANFRPFSSGENNTSG